MRKFISLLLNIFYLFGYVHEALHYIPACLFGLNPQIEMTRVKYKIPDKSWKEFVIAITPLSVFLTVLILAIAGWNRSAKTPADNRIWAGWILVCLGWIGTCLADVKKAVHIFRGDKS
jgi:hypothetical protein